MKKGMALVTILMFLIILVMIITALVAMNSNSLFYSLNYVNRISALSAAESGVTYAMYALHDNPAWEPGNTEFPLKNGKFTITFDKTIDSTYYSVNNLTKNASTTGAFGDTVDAYTVNLIVTGQVGNTIKRLRVVLGRTTIGEGGRISGTANVKAGLFNITRVTTPQDPSQGGSFHSNLNDPNSIVTSSDTMVNGYGGIISSVGGINIPAYDSSAGTQLKTGASPKPLPEINITQMVTDAAAKSSVHKMSGGTYVVRQDTAGGPYKLLSPSGSEITLPSNGMSLTSNGKLVFTEDVHFSSDVAFQFVTKDNNYKEVGIKLQETGSSNPSIFVNGTDPNSSFMVLGKLEGNGSIYNTGGTKFIMETDVTGGTDTGTTLFSEKNININLPASKSKAIDLSLTGAVLTHGNVNATIMEPNSADNPSVALGSDGWPSNWVEQAYSGAGDTTFPSNGTTFNINGGHIQLSEPPPLNSSSGGGNWELLFNSKTNGEANHDGLLYYNGNGEFSFEQGQSCGATHVHITFLKNGNEQPFNARVDIGTSYTYCDSSVPTWFTGGMIDGVDYNTADEKKALFDYICKTINSSMGGTNGGSTAATTTGSQLYAPNVTITGALMVTDPNNLDGSGGYNPDAGNINVNLIPPGSSMAKGNFKLIHSKKYEKLLADQELNLKMVVYTWEEIK